jgi:hypothetical protein
MTGSEEACGMAISLVMLLVRTGEIREEDHLEFVRLISELYGPSWANNEAYSLATVLENGVEGLDPNTVDTMLKRQHLLGWFENSQRNLDAAFLDFKRSHYYLCPAALDCEIDKLSSLLVSSGLSKRHS